MLKLGHGVGRPDEPSRAAQSLAPFAIVVEVRESAGFLDGLFTGFSGRRLTFFMPMEWHGAGTRASPSEDTP